MNTPDKRSRPGGTANGTLQTTEDGRLVLRYERRLAHSPQRVWRALTEPDPPRVFAFDWGEENLRFELRREGDGCLLVFNNTLDDRSKLARVGAGWHLCLDVLEANLDGRQLPWKPAGRLQARARAPPARPGHREDRRAAALVLAACRAAHRDRHLDRALPPLLG